MKPFDQRICIYDLNPFVNQLRFPLWATYGGLWRCPRDEIRAGGCLFASNSSVFNYSRLTLVGTDGFCEWYSPRSHA
jgi:hypothetical protein